MVNSVSFPMPQAFSGGVDFSPLARLGDIYRESQQREANQAALATFQQTGDPRSLLASGDMSLAQLGISAQNHMDALRQQAIENQRAAANLKLLQSREAREARDYENTPDQFVPNPKAGQPGEPAYIDQYAAATAASGKESKPVPYETLSGTKFLIPQQGGGYKVFDPSTVVAPPVPPAGDAAVPPQPGATAAPAAAGDVEAVDTQTGRRESFLKTLDPQIQDYVKKIADYEIDPRTTSIKGGMREKLMTVVSKYDPTYNQNEFGTRAKAMKDFSTGQQGNSVRTFDVAMDHLGTLKEYVAALNSGDVRTVNELRNKWLANTGSPLPTNVQAIAPVVGAEVTKAIVGSNNALADREELRKPLNEANSPAQILGAIDGYQKLMGGQLKGLKKQYEDTTGKKNFDTRVSENTRKALIGDAPKGGESGGKTVIPFTDYFK